MHSFLLEKYGKKGLSFFSSLLKFLHKRTMSILYTGANLCTALITHPKAHGKESYMTNIVRFLLFVLLFQSLLIAGCASPKKPRPAPIPKTTQALDFKQQVRNLADQMLATMDNRTLMGLVALPTSFVDMNNKSVTSSLGNLLGESLIYEFNQRGFPVREYRLSGNIEMKLGQGDFTLLRQGVMTTNERWAALIVGTYHADDDAVFVNARLVRAMDGMVLRTGQLILAKTPLIQRLSSATRSPKTVTTGLVIQPRYVKTTYVHTPPPPPLGLRDGTLNIRQVYPEPQQRGPGLYGVPY